MTWWVLALLILAGYVPFCLTGHLQEDALITFRTAFNLADHGSYSFNLGEGYPGATSIAYAHFVAAVRLLAGDSTVALIPVLGSVIVILSSWILVRTLGPSSMKTSFVAWVILVLSPATISACTLGMETPLLLLALAAALHELRFSVGSPLQMIALLLLPLLRPDAIASGILIALASTFFNRRAGIFLGLSLLLGQGIVFGANYFYTGTPFSLAATVKLIAYHPDRSFLAISQRVWDLFVSSCFLGMSGKHLQLFAPSGLLIVGTASVCLWRNLPTRVPRALLLTVLCHLIFVPIAFAIGGVIFGWYLWPSAWLGHALVAVACSLLYSRLRRPALWPVAVALLLGGSYVYQLALGINWGAQEARYRSSIGHVIRALATDRSTLFLEPAGYIPFYAQVTTYDHVGLTSSRVLPYLQRAPLHEAIVHFIGKEDPTFVVLRPGPLHVRAKETGVLDEYEPVQYFEYRPNDWARSQLERWVLQFGSHSAYYLYMKR